ncbi:MAG TPA: hypothetical protein VFJ57_00720 [Solirubrobacterales bacterium]|nr:hypothetical protein [Solirubrobacterales bacterium]
MVVFRALEDLALVGGSAKAQGLAVEVLSMEWKNLAEPHAGVGEGPDQRLVAAGGLGEGMHLVEREDADRAALLLRSRVVGADSYSLERVEVADFIRDRVLGHCRERAQDSDSASRRPTFVPQHVVETDHLALDRELRGLPRNTKERA